MQSRTPECPNSASPFDIPRDCEDVDLPRTGAQLLLEGAGDRHRELVILGMRVRDQPRVGLTAELRQSGPVVGGADFSKSTPRLTCSIASMPRPVLDVLVSGVTSTSQAPNPSPPLRLKVGRARSWRPVFVSLGLLAASGSFGVVGQPRLLPRFPPALRRLLFDLPSQPRLGRGRGVAEIDGLAFARGAHVPADRADLRAHRAPGRRRAGSPAARRAGGRSAEAGSRAHRDRSRACACLRLTMLCSSIQSGSGAQDVGSCRAPFGQWIKA